MHTVRHEAPLDDLALFLLRQGMKIRSQLSMRLAEIRFAPPCEHENHVIPPNPYFAASFGITYPLRARTTASGYRAFAPSLSSTETRRDAPAFPTGIS